MIPILEEKLDTNYVPTQAEIITIKQCLAGSEGHLRQLEAKVDELRNRCNQLVGEKQQLSTSVLKYKGILSPARRLIPDILQEIFYHCLPTSHNAIMSVREAPLLLGQICRHWREISHSTPRLWASIHISLPASKAYDSVRSADNSALLSVAASWLAHSGALPLSISLHSSIYTRQSHIPTNVHIKPFLDLLSSFAFRWKSISFRLENYDWTEFFHRFKAEDVPLLEKAHFDGNEVLYPQGEWLHPEPSATNRDYAILGAQQLRSVSIPRYATQILVLPVNWGQLVELNLSNGAFSLRDIQKALSLCPNLCICSISLSDWRSVVMGDEPYTPPKVVLPKLEVLSLRDDIAPHDMPALLESLIAPHVCHLSFRRGFDWVGNANSDLRPLVRTLSAFCRNLVHPLQELDLEANSISPESVMQILESVPGLKRLSLESYGQAEKATDVTYPWISPNTFYFTDEPLRRFIPRIVTVRHSEPDQTNHEPRQWPAGNWNLDSNPGLATSGPDVPLAALFNSPPTALTSESRTAVNRLCPNLEVFHCSGAMFSESLFLEFLRARTLKHHELGVAHLRRVSVSFVLGRKESPSFNERIMSLAEQTGTSIYLNYIEPLLYLPQTPDSVYSPYQGVDHEDDANNYPPARLGFW